MNIEYINSLDLKTGDIILFSGHESGIFSMLSWFVKFFTHSNYSHIGVILKDPDFISPELKGYYVWESSWEGQADPQDGKRKLGVQITPLQEIIDNFKESIVTVRKINSNKEFTKQKLQEIHSVVYNKPYDIVPTDWIQALFRTDISPQKTDRFWCSALVGYIYTKCNVLTDDTDWSILRPCDFSIAGEELKYKGDNKLDNQEIRIQ